MDVFLAFPLLVFAIALAGVVPDKAFGLHRRHAADRLLIFIIGFFNWPYIGRIVRGQTLSLREREFVDAARSLGARGAVHPLQGAAAEPGGADPGLRDAADPDEHPVRGGAVVPRRRVSGRRPPTWGGMLSDAARWYQIDPHFMFFPGLAIFVTVLAFNLFGDGLRDALDPKGALSRLPAPGSRLDEIRSVTR